MNRLLPIVLPLGSIAAVGAVMISLGVLFINVGATGTIIIGLALIVLVPLIGGFFARGNNGSPS